MTTFGVSMAASIREPIVRIANLAEMAEAHGFKYSYFIDSQMAVKDVYVTMAMAAVRTKSIRLGTGVTNPITRDLTVTAAAISAINEVSNGRAVLGMGNGGTSVWGIGLEGANLAATRAAFTTLRGLLDGQDVHHNGITIRMKAATPRIPIYVSGTRSKMLRLAGRHADGVIIMGSSQPTLLQRQLDEVFAGLRESGRDRTAFHVDLWQTISLRDDPRQAIEDVKSWVASQLVGWFARSSEKLPPELERVIDRERVTQAVQSYEIADHLSLHAKHRELVTDDLVGVMTISGDRQQCITSLKAICQLDVDNVTLSLLSGGREGRLEQLADAVSEAAAHGGAGSSVAESRGA